MSIAARLQELRFKKRSSLQQVADAVGISKTHVWELERGRTGNPSLEVLTKLANYFDITIRALVGEEPESFADERLVRMFRQAGELSERDRDILDDMIQSFRKKQDISSLTIDRMEIDDGSGDPVGMAAAITRQLPNLSRPVPVREIAKAIDIFEIREEPLDGLEGGLIVVDDRARGAILVHRDRPETRKRYTIAHEIGHYVIPLHGSDSLECQESDLRVEQIGPNDRARVMELQANQFATELLMPRQQVELFLGGNTSADIRQILNMADRFDVSREASARRYVALQGQPLAVVFSRNGHVRYIKANGGFPRLRIWGGDPLVAGSLSLTSQAAVGRVSTWAQVGGEVWLENCPGTKIWEQTLAQKNGFRMTLLKV